MNALAVSLITANLFLGSFGAQVLALQQILNRDPDTVIATAGPGSPGNETAYFGPLTKSAVVRFQEKYASEILTPAGLAHGNGYVGFYTKKKLGAFPAPNSVASAPATVSPSADYIVKENEKIDIYAGDKMLVVARNKIQSVIDSSIASHSTSTIKVPEITSADVPSVSIGTLSKRSGVSGTRISITGSGISSNSVVYLGNNYIVRTLNKDLFGNYSFIVPPIPPARYDIAVQTVVAISNTTMFVVSDQKNPPVHIENVSPANITYGGTITITGSGFSPKNNVVVTRLQTFADVPSADGKTLTVQFVPDSLRESAKVGKGKRSIPISFYVVNDYGFSDSEKSFTITL